MDLKRTIETITEIEARFDVNGLTSGRTNVWPLVRLLIFQQLCESVPQGSLVSEEPAAWYEAAANIKEKLSRVTKNPFRDIGSVASYPKSGERPAREEGQVDMLFFSRLAEQTELVDSKFYNPYIDTMIEFVKKEYSFLKIELEYDRKDKRLPRFEPTFFMDPAQYILKRRLKTAIWRTGKRDAIVGLAELQKVASTVDERINLTQELLADKIRYLYELCDFFTEVLNKTKPAVVFVVCFYALGSMAMIRAAKRLGIKTVDIQHGKQGVYNGLYTHWTRVPKGGYELLPDYFWVWGEECKTNILRKMGPERAHMPVVGGNRWMSRWVGARARAVEGVTDAFPRAFHESKKKILVTLQSIEEPLPAVLLEAMKMSPSTWFWLVRLHPLMKERNKEIEERLTLTGAAFEIDESTDLPLFQVLGFVDYHLTAWSSVAYEALTFKVPTVIVHKTGKDLYEKYIEKGIFSYAASGSELMEILKKDKNELFREEESSYVETSDTLANSALDTIMQSDPRAEVMADVNDKNMKEKAGHR